MALGRASGIALILLAIMAGLCYPSRRVRGVSVGRFPGRTWRRRCVLANVWTPLILIERYRSGRPSPASPDLDIYLGVYALPDSPRIWRRIGLLMFAAR